MKEQLLNSPAAPNPLPAWLSAPGREFPPADLRTRDLSPWNLRPGMKIVLSTRPDTPSGSVRLFTITGICKFRSRFTGAMCWRVTYADPARYPGIPPSIHVHGSYRNSLRRVPAEKLTIAIL